MRRLVPRVLAVLVALQAAEAAAIEPERRGLQVDGTIGVSACVPDGEVRCRRLEGSVAPLAGANLTVGWRIVPWLLLGGAYEIAGLRPTFHDILGAQGRRVHGTAHQHAVLGVIRSSVDIGRLDLGVEIGLGWSRQAAAYELAERRGERLSSQGFALRATPLLAVYLTRRLFIGARIDFLFNFHTRVCDGGRCERPDRYRPAFGHHVLAGLMLGVTI